MSVFPSAVWNFIYLIDYFLLLPILSLFPVPVAYGFARWRGKLRAWWNPSRPAVAATYAERLLGESGNSGAERYLEIVACDELDAYVFLFKSSRQILQCIQVEGEEHIQEVRQKGKGAILLSAHLGGGFFIFPFLHSRGIAPQMMMRPATRENFPDFFTLYLYARFREWCVSRAIGFPPLLSGRDVWETARVVRQGAFLWIALDVPPHLTGKTKQTEFFGRAARFPYGAFVLAARAEVPIIPFFSLLNENNQRTFRFLPPIWPTPAPQEMEKAFHFCVQLLEKEIRTRPEQWFFWEGSWIFFEPPVEDSLC